MYKYNSFKKKTGLIEKFKTHFYGRTAAYVELTHNLAYQSDRSFIAWGALYGVLKTVLAYNI